MPVDIPTQISFQKLLAHTFPGIFVALSLFMFIDIFSPYDLTNWAFGTISNFLSALGFFILLGTILGVIIDGIHHWVFEGLFNSTIEIKKVTEEGKSVLPELKNRRLSLFYYGKILPKDIHEFIINEYYCYSEFYVNTAISLIPFAVVFPVYLFSVLYVNWGISLVISLTMFILAYFSLKTGFIGYKIYHVKILDMIYGALEYNYFLEIDAPTPSKPGDRIPIKAQVMKIKFFPREEQSKTKVKIGSVKVKFRVTGVIQKFDEVTTDCYGIAETQICSNETSSKKGVVIITASSDGLISGQTIVEIKG